ncbi:ABC transporter ATP-binding protein [Alkalihalobacillus trypoxylicola]|uniref:ABC transporter n=1 Tax=Alkalihalobacillus trypoxylicola TaxID=519424 RepID=A0A161PG33_9BACI|nr:ABC transporter ATP-binding protein [Alkalihalobacillus trypoxylicola]KYG27652.1 ABC transporter [Alkalihalobacillus trypoxylicola]
MFNTLKKMMQVLHKKDKQKFLYLFLMMIIAALLETIGVGLIVPVVSVITNPAIIEQNPLLFSVYQFLNVQSEETFVLILVLALLFTFVSKNVYLLLFFKVQFKLIFNTQVKLAKELFQEYLKKPYTFHLQRNTSELLRNVNSEVPKVFQGIILSTFHLLTEVLVVLCLLTLLIYSAPIMTLTASVLLGGSIVIFFKLFKEKISQLGKEQQRVGGMMIKWVNQGLGASKELKVSGKENFFIHAYREQSLIQAKNNQYVKMLEQVPRLFIETLIVSMVLLMMIMTVFQGTSTTEAVSILALFAMAAFRLMPSINRIMTMITTIRYSLPALTVIHDDLIKNSQRQRDDKEKEHKKEEKQIRMFHDSLQLSNVSFRYPEQEKYSIKDISLRIPIGHSVAFIGESGAGKTTLVDLLLGILEPEKGSVLIDHYPLHQIKQEWQRRIGYIPQTIFLSDDSIRQNIAFGVEPDLIDDQKVWRAIEQAQLLQYVKDLPEQLDSNVGERGVKLSGGQRQRIGIARALYHNPEILFMDEATSALDHETEQEMMEAIEGLKGEKTIIMIAHRLSTIRSCEIVYKIHKGKLVEINQNCQQIII